VCVCSAVNDDAVWFSHERTELPLELCNKSGLKLFIVSVIKYSDGVSLLILRLFVSLLLFTDDSAWGTEAVHILR
jgi:hypothetical protein